MKPLILGVLFCTAAQAGELVYTPVNPSFGGNPINGSYLLSNAGSQNSNRAPALQTSTSSTSELERFTASLESRLTSQLLSDIGSGESSYLVTQDFTIDVVDDGTGSITVNVLDNATRETTSISVSGLSGN